jgi:thioredoxin-dependent peroxiredoxin
MIVRTTFISTMIIVLTGFFGFSSIMAGPKEDPMLLKIGSTAPDFTLISHTGDTVKLSSFREKNSVVLIFYPGDETPGGTKQLCTIRDDYTRFKEKNTIVFGMNGADTKSHSKFAANHKFQFPLLIDTDNKVSQAYGCKGGLMNKRTVYGIDKQGKIVFAQRGMPTTDEILKGLGD